MLSLSSLPSPMSLMPSPAPTPAPALPSNADVNEGKLSSSQMASCLENGCARSFGGKCNCKENCTCCRQAAMANKTSASATSQSPAPARESIPEDDKPVPIQLMRLVVQVDSSSLGKEYIVALLSVVPGIRSVHDVTDTADSKETSSPESSKSTNFVLRGDEGFDVARLDVLKSVQGIALRVIKQSTVPWLRKEVVLRVDEMMCPGNCGNTVVRAMRSVPHLEAANLIFGVRQVVARGTMGTDQLCAAVQAVGFEPCVDSVVPIPRRFRFCVSSLLESPFVGKKLIDTLRRVEGVESIVLVTERAEVLVVATLEEATPLLLAAARNGWAMVEVPEHGSAQAMSGRSSLTNSPSSSADDASTNSSALSTENASDHVCDIKVCPRNGCQQYMATVAHTAALAVGWVVPGCAMSWGGECTCGENCKCVGCPKHNPIT
ncbi:TPA: hypothetical protein N0F65_004370 [Lagenidium giganteum]|uniref:HMA domain-containing protein n=1 Tax=Lagenidium giganteum TaxID=4803 RepID=A0AAV2ZCI6_9STRA|nr:TPA: hypothetical protein N0F65_004370 [Lagenidium giganteum]